MLHILYIDDEPDLLDICKIFLEESGEFVVDTAVSPQKGLNDLKKREYDAVVCDYQMPEIDGITLLKMLRSGGSSIPFILFTGRGREEVVIQALNNGADFYLQKGGDPEAQFAELAHKVRQAVGKRKADELLRETNVYLNNLITNASGPIVTWDVDSRITRFNRAFEKLTGFSEADILGQDFDILFPEKTRADSLDLIVRALFGEKWESVEIPVRTADGEVRTVIWNSANIYAQDGTTHIATVAQGTDITERKKTEEDLQAAFEQLSATEEELRQQYEQLGGQEQELRRSQERLSSILSSTPTGIGIIRDQSILEVNDRFCEMTGYSRDEILNKNIRIIFENDAEYEKVNKSRVAGKDGESVTVTVETRLKKKEGTILAVVLSSKPLEPGNLSEGVTYTFLDITERIMAEEALRTANRKLNLLSSITRHDILNKTTIIDSNLILIRRMGGVTPEGEGYLNKIGMASKDIQSQIIFSRVYQDLGNTEARWQDMQKIISGAQVPETIQYDANLKGIEIYADPMLEKVFFNLFDNSLRHGQTVSRIGTSSVESEKGLTILFDDDGIGIADEEKERIFERGYGKNTGLGLFLSREILAITGIGISETGVPGKGARFELSVPKGVYRLQESGKSHG